MKLDWAVTAVWLLVIASCVAFYVSVVALVASVVW